MVHFTLAKRVTLKEELASINEKYTLRHLSAHYNLDKLVYFEISKSKEAGKLREKQLKKWNRTGK